MTLFLALISDAFAIDEVVSFGVDEHSSTCSGNPDLSYAIAQANAFDDVFDGWATWDVSLVKTDAAVDMEDFTDVSQYAWGADDADTIGADFADVSYLSTHGLSECESGDWSRVVMGQDNQSHGCRAYTNTHSTSAREMEFGNATDGDAEIVILDTCQSVQKCVWEGAGYGGIFGAEMNMLAGFHGDSRDSAGQVNALEDYASTSRFSGVGDHWLDERVTWNIFANLDQCPTVLIWGSSSSVRDDFYDNGGLDDYFTTGAHNGTTFYYLSGCDPDNGEQL